MRVNTFSFSAATLAPFVFALTALAFARFRPLVLFALFVRLRRAALFQRRHLDAPLVLAAQFFLDVFFALLSQMLVFLVSLIGAAVSVALVADALLGDALVDLPFSHFLRIFSFSLIIFIMFYFEFN